MAKAVSPILGLARQETGGPTGIGKLNQIDIFCDTVDGSEIRLASSYGRYLTIYKVLQDFFHQQTNSRRSNGSQLMPWKCCWVAGPPSAKSPHWISMIQPSQKQINRTEKK